jgi:hypothetical protein
LAFGSYFDFPLIYYLYTILNEKANILGLLMMRKPQPYCYFGNVFGKVFFGEVHDKFISGKPKIFCPLDDLIVMGLGKSIKDN